MATSAKSLGSTVGSSTLPVPPASSQNRPKRKTRAEPDAEAVNSIAVDSFNGESSSSAAKGSKKVRTKTARAKSGQLSNGDYRTQLAKMRATGEKSIDLANELFIIGWSSRGDEDCKQTVECLTEALAIKRELLGKNDQGTIASENCIKLLATAFYSRGMGFLERGDFQRAPQQFTSALTLRTQVLGENDPDIARTLYDLAKCQFELGETAKALELHNRALHIRMQIQNVGQEDIADSYYWLGVVHNKMKEYSLAVDYLSKAIEIESKIYEENDPKRAKAFFQLGKAYLYQKDYLNATFNLNLALKIGILTEEDNCDLALTFCVLGKSYSGQGDYQNAFESFTQAYQIRQRVLGDENSETKEVRADLEEVQKELDAINSALYLDEALREE